MLMPEPTETTGSIAVPVGRTAGREMVMVLKTGIETV